MAIRISQIHAIGNHEQELCFFLVSWQVPILKKTTASKSKKWQIMNSYQSLTSPP